MHDEKQKRLEAKGWRVGSAKEFLGLTLEEDAYIELKLRLAEGPGSAKLRLSNSYSEPEA